MTVIVGSNSTRTVVVSRNSAVNTVVQRATPVRALDRATLTGVVDRSDVVKVSSPGVQGRKGDDGAAVVPDVLDGGNF